MATWYTTILAEHSDLAACLQPQFCQRTLNRSLAPFRLCHAAVIHIQVLKLSLQLDKKRIHIRRDRVGYLAHLVRLGRFQTIPQYQHEHVGQRERER